MTDHLFIIMLKVAVKSIFISNVWIVVEVGVLCIYPEIMKSFVLSSLFISFCGISFCSPKFLSISSSFQIDTIKIIKNIQISYQSIKSREKYFKKSTKDILGNSSEGGEANVYYDDKELKEMVITNYGEIGKEKIEYYIDNGKVFFLYIKRTIYDKPIYEKNSKVSSIEEERFYFNADKMIRWVNSSKELVSPASEAFKMKEKELLNDTLFND